jgi:hypothetical protein
VFLAIGLAVALGVAGFVSGFASSEPDGLEKVAVEQGLDEAAADHALADSPLAGYTVDGVDGGRVATGIAGAAGVAITLGATLGLLYGVRRVRRFRHTDHG